MAKKDQRVNINIALSKAMLSMIDRAAKSGRVLHTRTAMISILLDLGLKALAAEARK